jgi:purine-nucleoside phosphorylase
MSDVLLSNVRTWIVSAWLPEHKSLIDVLSRGRIVETVSPNLKVTGPYAFLTTGVGTPRASMVLGSALTSALRAGSQTQSVFFVATAGAYQPSAVLNSAHLVSTALWSDAALAVGQSYLPQVDRFDELRASPEQGRQSRQKALRALSTPSITLDNSVARSFSMCADLENLEIFGIALAASFAKIQWNAVLGISNHVGPDAHIQWKRHHESASKAAQEMILEIFPEELSR